MPAQILVLHLAAIVSSICSLGALDVKDRIQYNKDAPHLTGPVKNILYFLLVHPFFGLLPTLPMLGFLFGFHLDLWAFLATLDNGGNPPQLWRTFACIYTLCVIAFLCYMCCLKRFMATLRMVCLYTALMLIPLKYQGQISMTWLSTLAPLIAMLLLLVVQLGYILANDMFCGRRGSMHLKDNVQRACAVGFICGACACVAGICLLARLLDNPDSPVALEDNAYQRTMLPLTIGATVATVSLIVNASCRGSELTRFMFMHDAPGAAADDARSGAYEVSGLGLVELRTEVAGEPKSAYTHAFDCVCGGAY